MQQEPQSVPNPFGLMMNPEAVLQAIEQSDRLSALTRRVYRPLDRPLIPKKQAAEQAAFDAAVDLTEDDHLD